VEATSREEGAEAAGRRMGGGGRPGRREEGTQRRPGGGRAEAADRVAGRRTGAEGARSRRRFDPRVHRGSTGERPSRSFFLSGRPTSNHGPNLGAERLCKWAEPTPLQA
jgi:hypothetical protein